MDYNIQRLSRLRTRVHEAVRKQVKRMVDWHNCSPEALVITCKSLLGTDISKASSIARRWAESQSWDKRVEDFSKLLGNTSDS